MNSKVCRLCLKRATYGNEFISIFAIFSIGNNKKLKCTDAIMECTSIEINKNDDLPKYVCEKCVLKLEIAYNFRKTCLKSDYQLRSESKISGDTAEIYSSDSDEKITFENLPSNSESDYNVNIVENKDKLHSNKSDEELKNILKPVVRKEIIRKYKKKEIKRHVCPICSKAFSRSQTYLLHSRIHSGETPFMCELCGVRFRRMCSLRIHKLVHSGERPYKCSQCPKAYFTEAELKVHGIAHTNEYPYQCTKCNKKFKYRIGLWRHDMYHSGVRKHKCNICNKAFVEAQPLRRHMRVHTGERPNQCQICLKAFKEVTHLKTHMKVHKTNQTELAD